MINHRAINNQYFSSNVYRVRFKCLVKTNLRPRPSWTAHPFCPCSGCSGVATPPVSWPERRVYITNHGPRRKLCDLARNLSAPMEKVDRESPSADSARTAFAQRLASHGRLDRARSFYAPSFYSGSLCLFRYSCQPRRAQIESRGSLDGCWIFSVLLFRTMNTSQTFSL